jgi:hypothetical protein
MFSSGSGFSLIGTLLKWKDPYTDNGLSLVATLGVWAGTLIAAIQLALFSNGDYTKECFIGSGMGLIISGIVSIVMNSFRGNLKKAIKFKENVKDLTEILTKLDEVIFHFGINMSLKKLILNLSENDQERVLLASGWSLVGGVSSLLVGTVSLQTIPNRATQLLSSLMFGFMDISVGCALLKSALELDS